MFKCRYSTLEAITLCLVYLSRNLYAETITYMSLERPCIEYTNPKYVKDMTLTAFRYGRRSPVHYVKIKCTVLAGFGNNVTFDFVFHEFLSNRYRPSFVEMHFKFCDLIHKDKFFGPAFKQGKLDAPCPYPPDTYELTNMTVLPEVIPRGFPFRKGRIFANLTLNYNNELVISAHLDMELKEMHVTNRKKNTKL